MDLKRIGTIDRVNAGLDPLETCCRKRMLGYQAIGPLVLQTRPVLEQTFRGVRKALDVGCGDGQALLDFVSSERGLIGHADFPLAEALRVLSPGGKIFVKTLAWSDLGRTVLTNL